MARVRITLEGEEQLAAALRRLGAVADEEVRKAISATGVSLRSDIQRRTQKGPKTGRIYKRKKGKPPHQASAPGEAPATDTGRLVGGVTFEMQDMAAEVRSEVAYAAELELGTSRVAPRPSWTPAVEEQRPKFIKRMQAALRRAMARAEE